jgi:hypothetical protein
MAIQLDVSSDEATGVTEKDVMRHLLSIEMAAQSLFLNIQSFRSMMETGMGPEEQDPAKLSGPPIECTCPPKFRMVAAVQGHPTRTKCRNCGKEYD